MTSLADEVKSDFSLSLSVDYAERCQQGKPDLTSSELYDRALRENLRDICGASLLPYGVAAQVSATLPSAVVLQINSSRDATQPLRPCADVADEDIILNAAMQRNSDKRLLRLLLTDGNVEIPALELSTLTVFRGIPVPGEKVLIRKDAEVRNGCIILSEDNVRLLGGEVQQLKQDFLAHRRRLEAGYQTSSGLHGAPRFEPLQVGQHYQGHPSPSTAPANATERHGGAPSQPMNHRGRGRGGGNNYNHNSGGGGNRGGYNNNDSQGPGRGDGHRSSNYNQSSRGGAGRGGYNNSNYDNNSQGQGRGGGYTHNHNNHNGGGFSNNYDNNSGSAGRGGYNNYDNNSQGQGRGGGYNHNNYNNINDQARGSYSVSNNDAGNGGGGGRGGYNSTNYDNNNQGQSRGGGYSHHNYNQNDGGGGGYNNNSNHNNYDNSTPGGGRGGWHGHGGERGRGGRSRGGGRGYGGDGGERGGGGFRGRGGAGSYHADTAHMQPPQEKFPAMNEANFPRLS